MGQNARCGDTWGDDTLLCRQCEFMKDLLLFVHDVATNYDHDEDAHKYGTHCRMCEAEKLWNQYRNT